jgi:hypothetical protein
MAVVVAAQVHTVAVVVASLVLGHKVTQPSHMAANRMALWFQLVVVRVAQPPNGLDPAVVAAGWMAKFKMAHLLKELDWMGSSTAVAVAVAQLRAWAATLFGVVAAVVAATATMLPEHHLLVALVAQALHQVLVALGRSLAAAAAAHLTDLRLVLVLLVRSSLLSSRHKELT